MMSTDPAQPHSSLVSLVAAPAVWAAHFLSSYITAAIWCAKVAGPDGSSTGARLAIAAYTFAALIAIAWIAVRAWRHHRAIDPTLPDDRDTPAARHRFIALATLLLAGLAAIAIIYAALAAAIVGSCR
jgi:hypothetical protein